MKKVTLKQTYKAFSVLCVAVAAEHKLPCNAQTVRDCAREMYYANDDRTMQDVLACATYAHILYELSCMTGDDRLQDLAAAYGRAQTVLAVR